MKKNIKIGSTVLIVTPIENYYCKVIKVIPPYQEAKNGLNFDWCIVDDDVVEVKP